MSPKASNRLLATLQECGNLAPVAGATLLCFVTYLTAVAVIQGSIVAESARVG